MRKRCNKKNKKKRKNEITEVDKISLRGKVNVESK